MTSAKINDVRTRLDKVEARLQTIIEGGITLLLPIGNPQKALTELMVKAMRANLEVSPNGQTITIPNTFNIIIHPSRLSYWQNHQSFLDTLAHELYQAGQDLDFHFKSTPNLVLVTNKEIPPNDLKVTAVISQVESGETSSLVVHTDPEYNHSQNALPDNAFLIVNGGYHFSLDRSVTNIGRRLDNHLVVDDPRVSRNHVQLRAVKGRFIIFDLNSTGGTFVNGKRINQCILSPGDVISLAGFPLIYGQDLATNITDTGSLLADDLGEDSQPV